MSLADSAASGDRLQALEDLRQTLAERIDASDSARDVAQLAGHLLQVLKQIEELDRSRGEKLSKVDELAARRKQRTKPVRDGRVRESN